MFRNEALKEADEISALPVQSRVAALEKVLRRLLTSNKPNTDDQALQVNILVEQ